VNNAHHLSCMQNIRRQFVECKYPATSIHDLQRSHRRSTHASNRRFACPPSGIWH
jgi:uncharacterized protein CbrC (UPF0167 family)